VGPRRTPVHIRRGVRARSRPGSDSSGHCSIACETSERPCTSFDRHVHATIRSITFASSGCIEGRGTGIGRHEMVSRGLIAALRIAAPLPVFIFAVLWAASPSYGSTASAWQRAPESGVRLLSAVSGTGDLAALPLGLEFELAPGWKTYWRS